MTINRNLPLEILSIGDPVNQTADLYPISAVVLLPLLCFCLLSMRPSVRLGVVPSDMNQILFTGM